MSQRPILPPMPRDPSPRVHLDYLDGLRAVAALWVVCNHTVLAALPPAFLDGRWGFVVLWMTQAHLAVDIFIVLSGFCLVLPVARHGTLPGGAAAFFARRAWRILPTFWAALVLSMLLNAACHLVTLRYPAPPPAAFVTRGTITQAPAAPVAPSPRWRPSPPPVPAPPGPSKRVRLARVFLVNALLLQDWLPAENQANTAFWSVAVEWKIYFLFPALVWLLRRSVVGALSGAVLVSVVAVAAFRLLAPQMSLELTCPWYPALFALGVCAGYAAFGPRRVSPRPAYGIGLAGLGATGWLLRHPPGLPAGLAQVPIDVAFGVSVASALFLMAGATGMPLRGPLAWHPLVQVGTFSYSLYLIHAPVFLLLRAVWTAARFPLLPVSLGLPLLVLGLVPVLIGAAYLFFLAFEKPFLTRRSKETPAEVARDAALSPAP